MKIMANNSEERKFRRRIKLFEEEEIDRRLKGIDCSNLILYYLIDKFSIPT